MVCDITSNSINPPIFPPIPGPGGIPFAPIQIPLPNIKLPTDLLEDLLDLVSKLGLIFPSSTFKPNINEFTKTILDAVSSLLSQVAPFLSFYNFIMAFLKLILCIIEVLCAIPNPFKIASAMVKLFSQCLPPFIALFPFLALIAMIIALLLLILALIEYIIATIIALIEEIIKNLKILGQGVTLKDAEATLAAIQKISDLLCIMQNIMAIFVALGAIMAIIEALALVAGGPVCDGDDPNGCCSPDVCPPFIKDSPFSGKGGELKYYNQIGVDLATALGIDPAIAALFKIPPTRTERWQFVDAGTSSHYFVEIIEELFGTSFWPEGVVFDSNTVPDKFPYTVDMRVKLDPHQFVSSDKKGLRFMRIKNCGVVRRPYVGLLNQQEQLDITSLVNPTLNRGTLNLEGGLVFEDDGTTEYKVNDIQATLNTFIHKDTTLSTTVQSVDDGVVFSNIEFTFNSNHTTLMSYSLITAGCLPTVAIEKAIFNNILVSEDVRAVVNKLPARQPGQVIASTGFLPNVTGAQNCVINALDEFRKNVSIENAAVFQASALTCLNDLKDQTQDLVCQAIIAATSQYKSLITLDTDVQFTSRAITASIEIKDANSTSIGINIPAHCVPEVEAKIKGEVTFGSISEFKYDGAKLFNAKITSDVSGSGKLTVLFNEKVISTVVADLNGGNTTVSENVLDYSFVGVETEPAVRRNATDVANVKKE